MIRAIDFQKVDMTDEEHKYYLEIVKNFTTADFKGAEYFHDLFIANEKGIITIIKPSKPVPWEVIFFVQNLMINQQLRDYDSRIKHIEDMIGGQK